MEATSKSGGRDFKASDLLKLAGLTYRRLQDWENRAGVMTSQRATGAGWRKFSLEEVYALRICSDLRKHIPLSLDAIGKIYAWLMSTNRTPEKRKFLKEHGVKLILKMAEEKPEFASLFKDDKTRRKMERMALEALEEKVSNVRLAVEQAEHGQPFYLFTDLESHLILSESMLEQILSTKLCQRPLIIFMLNKSLNTVREMTGQPAFPFDEHSRFLFACLQDTENLKKPRGRETGAALSATEAKLKPSGRSSPKQTTLNKPRSEISLGVVQSDVKKPRRRIANVDVGAMQTNLGR
jgi:DNA-binding transcriptional MerR regulator